jgi:hypothetical protein
MVPHCTGTHSLRGPYRLARLRDEAEIPCTVPPSPAHSAAIVSRVSALVAELEPGPPLVIVTDLQGACEHAAAFGELEGQTLEEAWTLIEAALDVASGERGGYA